MITLKELLNKYAIKEGNCYVSWLAQDRSGYCRLSKKYMGEKILHRVAWVIKNGPIPKGVCVLHHCDNPACCNPKHLFLGTRADNNQDKVNKNRQTQGEEVNTAKLTKQQVLQIRSLNEQGWKVNELITKFPIRKSQMYNVINQYSWKDKRNKG